MSQEIINGSTPPKSNYKYWEKRDINWMTVTDFPLKGLSFDKTVNFVSNLALKDKKIRIVPKNSVIISCTATIGKVGINTIELSTNQQINAIICKSNIYPSYLARVLKIFGKNLIDLTSNSGVKHINLNVLGNFKIPLPPLKVQEEITHEIDELEEKSKTIVINDLDDQIENIIKKYL